MAWIIITKPQGHRVSENILQLFLTSPESSDCVCYITLHFITKLENIQSVVLGPTKTTE